MRTDLLIITRSEVEAFFYHYRNTIFSNERHLQITLCLWLQDSFRNNPEYSNAKIHPEYFVPLTSFQYEEGCETKTIYPWKSGDRMYVDIVVECNDEYLPIEIKYRTNHIDNPEYTRFGDSVGITRMLTDQVDTNLGYYECWSDVKRLEMLAERFDKIKNGLFVFLSNNHLYFNKPKRKDNKSREFAWYARTAEEDNPQKRWPEDFDSKGRPDLEFAKGYAVTWSKIEDCKIDYKFCYCLIEIEESDVMAAKQKRNWKKTDNKKTK